MRKTFTFLFFALLLAGWQASAATVTIMARNNFFSPSNVTINPGDVVMFQWEEGVHTTTSDNGAWPSLPLDAANPTQMLNLGPGTYPYHCSFHGAPGGVGMSGTITVRTVSGLNDLKPVATLNAFPNPSRGETTFTLNQAGKEEFKLRITNAIGKTIKIVPLKEAKNSDSKTVVDLSKLPSGYYFYSLITNDKMVETKRLILQR
ncbi:T9SS type A sorting domain-containing protein [Adhaeribacter soli]|uniref:T9SS type A sorting domain-containing protein n=1 Tax=Adhaeribacter soli TaxID=2607655 RepID=A0A5N1ISU1_9BACT|nr:T9SS type A sorting domain-containing protein [Adhaeribacter soli]KAA9331180.1 T9SS type A sorting domain-containing protein [Adhaeribacter soli]